MSSKSTGYGARVVAAGRAAAEKLAHDTYDARQAEQERPYGLAAYPENHHGRRVILAATGDDDRLDVLDVRTRDDDRAAHELARELDERQSEQWRSDQAARAEAAMTRDAMAAGMDLATFKRSRGWS